MSFLLRWERAWHFRAALACLCAMSTGAGLAPRPAMAGETKRPQAEAAATPHARAARPQSRRAPARPVAAARGTAGMRVILDPATGERIARPTHGPVAPSAARPTPSGPAAGLRTERRADGTTILFLDDRFLTYEVVRVDSAGGRAFDCVTGAEAARRALAKRPAARRAALAGPASSSLPATVPATEE